MLALPSPDRREAFRAFNEGSECRLYDLLGAHVETQTGEAGARFAVWAPNARAVSVIGDFNEWDKGGDPLSPAGDSGVWEAFVPAARGPPGAPCKEPVTVTGRTDADKLTQCGDKR